MAEMARARHGFWRKAVALALALSVLGASGCASKMMVRTNPEGAEVYVDGEPLGKSPATWEGTSGLPNKTVTVEARKEGYEDAVKNVKRSELNAGYMVVGILLFWPAILWSWEWPDSVALELERAEHPNE